MAVLTPVRTPLQTLHPSKIMYIGMDIHKETHAVYASDCFGTVCLNKEIRNDESGFNHLVQTVNELTLGNGLTPIFGLEDTGGYGRKLAKFLVRENLIVKNVNPIMVTRERSKTAHPEKNDLLDAKGVAKVLIHEGIDTLPNYRLSEKSDIAKGLRNIINDRTFLVKERTRIKNQLHILLCDKYGFGYKSKYFKSVFTQKALKFFLKDCRSKRRKGDSQLSSLDLSILNSQIRRKFERIIGIQAEVKEIEGEIRELVDTTNIKIETMPGCGLVTAATIIAEVSDVNRFQSAAKLAKYAGLAPREKSSGKTKNMFKSKAGNKRLKGAFHAVALSQIGRHGNKAGKEYYSRKVSEGKTKMQALTHLKRKIVDIIYLMLKNETEYNYD